MSNKVNLFFSRLVNRFPIRCPRLGSNSLDDFQLLNCVLSQLVEEGILMSVITCRVRSALHLSYWDESRKLAFRLDSRLVSLHNGVDLKRMFVRDSV